ncbi:MAG: transglutaminase domain-containing protein [Selenomonadaceae bacterium]|nr:transglutaminase domain-containing protein [Selenomonadaceae bacterium]
MKKFFLTLALMISMLSSTVNAADVHTLINNAPLTPTYSSFEPCNEIVYNTLNRITRDWMTTYDKVKVCYDYLIESCYYGDNRTMNLYPADTPDEGAILAYCMLSEHVGACDHYSCAFAALVRAIGLNCYTVYGQTSRADGGMTGHIWTVINIDGTEYVFDPQIDDNIAGGGPTGYYRFGVTYDEVAGCYAHFYNNHYFRPIRY